MLAFFFLYMCLPPILVAVLGWLAYKLLKGHVGRLMVGVVGTAVPLAIFAGVIGLVHLLAAVGLRQPPSDVGHLPGGEFVFFLDDSVFFLDLIALIAFPALAEAFCGWLYSAREYGQYSRRERLRKGWALPLGFGLLGVAGGLVSFPLYLIADWWAGGFPDRLMNLP